MLVFTSILLLKEQLQTFKNQGQSIGFVPTMGALHRGHLSLIEESLKVNDVTVVSIFVNPTQFNNQEDIDKYPRTVEEDIALIHSLNARVIIFIPSVKEMYQQEIVSNHFEFDGIEHELEGKFRPGHFDGVATVVKHLFEIVTPNRAYFGEKDFQQLQIIRKLVKKLSLEVEIKGCPIYREPNGLAMSSRNQRLNSSEKEEAKIIYQALLEAKKQFGTKSVTQIKKWILNFFKNNSNFKLEYFEIADEDTLKPITRKIKTKKYRAFIAVYCNTIRLIDTISLN